VRWWAGVGEKQPPAKQGADSVAGTTHLELIYGRAEKEVKHEKGGHEALV
jgi:hypothetical protein